MNLYYAMGGGLGHLTRAAAFINNFGIEKNTSILTLSEFAKDKRVVGNINVIEVTKEVVSKEENYLNFLKELFATHSFERAYLDTFPYGIKREFSNFDFGKTKINYIARLLNWGSYLKCGSIEKQIQFDESFILEYLEREHRDFISKNSNKTFHLRINYPKPSFSPKDTQIIEEIKQKKDFWLVVHSGGEDEIFELISIADEQRRIEKKDLEIVIITPMDYTTTLPNCSSYDIFPASILFPFAERIFTACGFNVMQQTAKFRHKHQFIPFWRTYDKQYQRAERFRNN